jgi:hypothetical protein
LGYQFPPLWGPDSYNNGAGKRRKLTAAAYAVHIMLGRDMFLHRAVPKGWWDEYSVIVRREFDPGILMARSSIMAFTWTETRRMLNPIGIDRWP